jgi:hypothetical protein
MVSTRFIQRALIGALVGLALAACGAPASEVRNLPSETAVITATASPSFSGSPTSFSSSSPSAVPPTTAAAAPPSAEPAAVAPVPVPPAPVAPAVQAPAPVVPAAPAPAAPANPVPAAPQPAAPNTVQGIIPGAFCPNADVGMQGVAANGRTYVCGGKGADKNGHYHWNV